MKETSSIFERFDVGVYIGVGFSLVVVAVVLAVGKPQFPTGWCDDIAKAAPYESYKMSYERCMSEYRQRKGIKLNND